MTIRVRMIDQMIDPVDVEAGTSFSVHEGTLYVTDVNGEHLVVFAPLIWMLAQVIDADEPAQ